MVEWLSVEGCCLSQILPDGKNCMTNNVPEIRKLENSTNQTS